MAYHPSLPLWKNLLNQGLQDDSAQWDWTALGSVAADRKAKAWIVAKSEGIWAADELVPATLQMASDLGADLKLESKVRNGQLLKKGDRVVEWSGPARAIL